MMPARNIYHDAVREALIADGWTITHDPLRIMFGHRPLYVDLGAEQSTLGAEREGRRICVEIASFLNPSAVRDLQEVVGQYQVYRLALELAEPDRVLYLAIPDHAHDGIFTERLGQLIITQLKLRLLVFRAQPGRVVQWIE